MVWLSGVSDSFEQAAETLERIGHITASDTTVWRRVQNWGARFEALEAAEREKANTLPADAEVERTPPEAARMGVGMDGTMVYIWDEGWKELKIGTVFEIEMRLGRDPHTDDPMELAHAVRNSYVAHLGGPEVLGQLTWAEARARGWAFATDTVAIGDGAPWIWNQVRDHFYDSQQIVDWYHAVEHLHEAARLVYGAEDGPTQTRGYNSLETLLFQGHASRVADLLDKVAATKPEALAEDLQSEATFFRNQKRRMQYMDMRNDGWPLGSGMVESGAKQFKARFDGPGMRWRRDCIQKLLPIRAAVLSKRFDDLWQQAYNLPLN